MNVDHIMAVIVMHQPVVVTEESGYGLWRTRCACGDVRDSDLHARHVAEEIMGVCFPPAPPPAWSIPGVGLATQLAFDEVTA